MKESRCYLGFPLYCHICEHPVDGDCSVMCLKCLEQCQKALQPCEILRDGISTSDIRIFSLFDYYASHQIIKLVRQIKFENRKILLTTLLSLVKDWSFLPPVSEIWYVPSSFRKFLERGYNPSNIIAKFLGRKFSIPVKKHLKKKDTLSQSSKSREERRKSLKSHNFYISFSGKRSSYKDNQSLLLIDDIVTTGTTLLSNAREISKLAKGLNIIGLALFHADVKQ